MENKQASIEKDNEARRQYEETKQAKEADIERMLADQSTKQNEKVDAESTVQTAIATIGQGNTDISAADEYLSLLTQDREHFTTLYNERLMMRQNEMAATQAALDALQQVSVGNSVKALLLQGHRVKAGLLQADARQVRLQKAAEKLAKVGTAQKSGELLQAAVALRQVQHYDPSAMNPVKDLLRQLITRLEEELSAETSHKEWCDTEKAQSAEAKPAREQRGGDHRGEEGSGGGEGGLRDVQGGPRRGHLRARVGGLGPVVGDLRADQGEVPARAPPDRPRAAGEGQPLRGHRLEPGGLRGGDAHGSP